MTHFCLHCKKLGDLVFYKSFNFTGNGGKGLSNFGLGYWLHKGCYDEWYKDLVANLAELDQIMNYCFYFQRQKGQIGKYTREGKSFEVSGEWDGYHIKKSILFPYHGFNYTNLENFRNFLEENNWLDDWFKIKPQYEKYL